MCRYLAYIVWCAASIVLFVCSLLLQPCPTGRRLSSQPRPIPPSAFAQLTNSTPTDNDLIVAIRCNMVHEDETFDICNPSSTLSRSSSIVQRDARSYDRVVMNLFTSNTPSSMVDENGVTAPTTAPTTMPTAPTTPSEASKESEIIVSSSVLIVLSSIILVVVLGHTAAISLSISYHLSPSWFLTVIRMILASFAILVSVATLFIQCGPHLLLASSAITVYIGCLLEPYIHSLWVRELEYN